ncbi:PepSY-associated TM helix domain-containing protein [uncultured Erythrobacter sp.]|uniref:PepSY-associated TM helix domain-containing protein n=1 Tax=uncultured Erythrobacter sp. TaxID=263913 RepID=UPI00262DD00C|nr:PepSY-associated TM helix domain-containing protein [uncultured Erythrobacter sp.]
MNAKRLFRQVHYWLSVAVFIPAAIVFVAGGLLMLKKEIEWIQPGTERGVVEGTIPTISYDQMVEAARAHPEAGIEEWTDIDRIDLRVDRGIAKLRANSGWEVQVDTSTAEVLKVAYRRSDTIEAIHDGSWFADWIKLYVFLPVGVILIIMWGTGGYLFVLPYLAKSKKKRAKREAAQKTV